MRRHGLLVHVRARERLGVHAGDHAGDVLQGAHALELLQLVVVVGERELVLLQALGQLRGLLLVEVLLGLFDEA